MTLLLDAPRPAWRIVIMDDNPEDRAEIRRLLLRESERRYTFVEAGTAEDGLRAIIDAAKSGPEGAPDCVLLDYHLPDADAPEVLAQLIGPEGPLCPVVVLTAQAGGEHARAAIRAGAQDYLGKGWMTPEGLVRALENAAERWAMARELRARERSLRESEERLQEADRRKDEFLATLAHELRNPLAPLRTGLQVLKLSPPGSASEVKVRDMMERQIGHIVRLVDDLLDISRISRGKFELRRERVDVRAVLEHAIEASRPLVEAAGHTLVVRGPEAPLWLDGDLTRLAQVVSNLLNNAAKYTPNGGRIELSVEGAGREVVLRVIDNGVGISAEMLPRVFELFTQMDCTLDRAQGGLGIGLSLVRGLVEMHGGKISAESAGVGRGSTFTVRLPIAAPGGQPWPGMNGAPGRLEP